MNLDADISYKKFISKFIENPYFISVPPTDPIQKIFSIPPILKSAILTLVYTKNKS